MTPTTVTDYELFTCFACGTKIFGTLKLTFVLGDFYKKEIEANVKITGLQVSHDCTLQSDHTDLVTPPVKHAVRKQFWSKENPCMCGATSNTSHSLFCGNTGLYDDQGKAIPTDPADPSIQK